MCPCGRVVTRGHFVSCPLTTFNNQLTGRLAPRALWYSFQLFKVRASQIELWGQAWDVATGQPVSTLRSPFPLTCLLPSLGSRLARLRLRELGVKSENPHP